MLVCNPTPFLFGPKAGSRKPPQVEMTCVVRGRFRIVKDGPAALVEGPLGQGALSSETFGPDDEEGAGPVTYPGDFADHKIGAEVLLMGKCHSPRGAPVTECPVVFRVGEWRKALRVLGKRRFTDKLFGPAMTAPEPFTEVDLTWANTFGGPGFERNPLGRGVKTEDAPQVLAPGGVVESRRDTADPASFGPVPSTWAERARRKGKDYGRSWKETRAPFYSQDFDYRHFNSAPPDQWLSAPLAGGEEVFLQNLHPTEALLTTRLPGLRIRVFVRGRDGDFREVMMALDTLLVEPEIGVLTLTWRGLTPVAEIDLSDVASALVAAEPLAGPAKTVAEYRAELEEHERDPVGLRRTLPEGVGELLDAHERELRGEPPPPAAEGEGSDPVSALLRQKMGGFRKEDQRRFGEMAQAASKRAAETKDVKLDLAAEVASFEGARADEPPVAMIPAPGAIPNLGLRRKMRSILEQAAAVRKQLAEPGVPADTRTALEARLAEMERVPFDPRWKQADPDYTPPVEPISTDEPGPGADLSEQDLTGRDLSGKDLSGARFVGTLLTRADLSKANLEGACFKNAILFRTNLAGARLAGADLTRANAAEVRADGASFEGANLEHAYLDGARLAGADLSGATGSYPVFEKANLAGAKLAGAKLSRGTFTGASLEDADLGGAALPGGRFLSCRAARSRWTGCDVTGASFEQATLTGATFADARGEGVVFLKATLDGADLRFSVLPRALFHEASLLAAYAAGADLREGRFYRANLTGADLSRSNLHGADLSWARLPNAILAGASLYDAKLFETNLSGADLRGANTLRSTLELP